MEGASGLTTQTAPEGRVLRPLRCLQSRGRVVECVALECCGALVLAAILACQ